MRKYYSSDMAGGRTLVQLGCMTKLEYSSREWQDRYGGQMVVNIPRYMDEPSEYRTVSFVGTAVELDLQET